MELASVSVQDNQNIADKQAVLAKKIDKTNEGIASIVSKLTEAVNAESTDEEAIEAVQKLVSTVNPDQKKNPNLSNEDIKMICSQVIELFNDLNSFRAELSTITEEFEKLKIKNEKDLNDLRNKLHQEINDVKMEHSKEIVRLKEKHNENDQYLRSNNLVFRNLLPNNYKVMSGAAAFAHYVAEQINYFLPMLNIPVSVHNIDIAHPLRSNAKGQPPIIVRFTNRHVRHNVFENKDYLKRFGIFVTEHLTADNVKLLNKAQGIVGYENAWSFNGKIFALTNSGRVVLKTESDLTTLRDKLPTNNSSNRNTSNLRGRGYRGIGSFSRGRGYAYYGTNRNTHGANNNNAQRPPRGTGSRGLIRGDKHFFQFVVKNMLKTR